MMIINKKNLSTGFSILQQTKNMLHSQFDKKDMGLADVILGIKITKTPDRTIYLRIIML